MTDLLDRKEDYQKVLAEKEVLVFPIAPGDQTLANDIEQALLHGWENLGQTNQITPAVFILSGWLASPTKVIYERIRDLGRALDLLDTFSLWLLTAETSVDDIADFAPESLLITSRLLTAGIPVFLPESGFLMVENDSGKISSEIKKAWIDVLKSIGPGPATLSVWRHDIRGKILGVFRNYLQADQDALWEFAIAERTNVTKATWRSLIDIEPYRTQQPAIVDAAMKLIDGLDKYASSKPEERDGIRHIMQINAEALASALEASKTG